jgi:hypothetical protein
MCACSAASIFVFVSLRLLRDVTDRSSPKAVGWPGKEREAVEKA